MGADGLLGRRGVYRRIRRGKVLPKHKYENGRIQEENQQNDYQDGGSSFYGLLIFVRGRYRVPENSTAGRTEFVIHGIGMAAVTAVFVCHIVSLLTPWRYFRPVYHICQKTQSDDRDNFGRNGAIRWRMG